jgi:nicotinate-nucleotide--dimethylbenzimidazole phosphoribosyltransferase
VSGAWLREALTRLPSPDSASADAVRARAQRVLRPAGALAALDDLAAWVAGWQATTTPAVRRPAVIVFAADHGVAASGVSAYPTSVTAAMLAAYRASRSTVTTFAREVGASVTAVDVGVGRPTGDLRRESALTPERLDDALDAGRRAVEAVEADLVCLGEMGIGNTTAAAALSAALCGGDALAWVGRGTGVDDAGLARKRAAVRKALGRIGTLADPLAVLREVGGAEIAALVGALVAARLRRMPVLLDGFVVTVAACVLARLDPDAIAHCRAAHRSAEPGHGLLLETLGLTPLLDLGMRLGEASGAVAAVPLVRFACAGVVEVPTFEEWGVPT